MARTNITFDGVDLQSSTVIISDIAHESSDHKIFNIQNFAQKEGGNITDVSFDVRRVTISGIVKGTSKSDLETNIDTLKKNINKQNKNLDIDYESGTRRYVASGNSTSFERNTYTIDVISFEVTFIVPDPPFGKDLDTTTLEDTGNTNTGASTTTWEDTGTIDFGGTVRPYPKIKITINSINGASRIQFENTNEDGFFSRTTLDKPSDGSFQDGDVFIIDTEDGTVTRNGVDFDFRDGFPKFSLSNNSYTLQVVANSYNIDVAIIYYKLWL